MTASRIIIWRHGRTEWNAIGRFQGQADIGLDELGVSQASAAAPLLAELTPDAIIASDLVRATATAQALSDLTGLPVTTDKRLREIHVGTWEGLTHPELAVIDPESAARFNSGEDMRRSATGETIAEVADRVAEAIEETAAVMDDGTTLVVVMHGTAGRVGVGRLVGLPQDSWRTLGTMENCAWIEVVRHRSGDFWRIHAYNRGVS